MHQNPYESPRVAEGFKSERNVFGLRRKPWWGYPLAAVIGAFGSATAFGWMLSDIDDAGGTQLLIGAFLGLVIYGLLFPLTPTNPQRSGS
jgi:hypothetical protein